MVKTWPSVRRLTTACCTDYVCIDHGRWQQPSCCINVSPNNGSHRRFTSKWCPWEHPWLLGQAKAMDNDEGDKLWSWVLLSNSVTVVSSPTMTPLSPHVWNTDYGSSSMQKVYNSVWQEVKLQAQQKGQQKNRRLWSWNVTVLAPETIRIRK